MNNQLIRQPHRQRVISFAKMIPLYLLAIVVVFLVDLPLISMIGTAMKSQETALTSTTIFPTAEEFTMASFQQVLVDPEFLNALKNSLMIALCTSAIIVLASSMAGYAISRFRGRVFTLFLSLLLITEAFPAMLRLIPMFRMYANAGLIDTHISVIMCHVAQSLAFCTMMMRGFYESSVPKDMEEAAMVDGCTRFGTYLRIALPTSLPGVATIAIYSFLDSWNEFMYANLMLRDDELQTLTLYVTQFSGQGRVDWPMLSAASTIATIPALFFLLFAQKYLIQGMTDGAVKG